MSALQVSSLAGGIKICPHFILIKKLDSVTSFIMGGPPRSPLQKNTDPLGKSCCTSTIRSSCTCHDSGGSAVGRLWSVYCQLIVVVGNFFQRGS